jgi:5-methylcytosine-specific restriction protein A
MPYITKRRISPPSRKKEYDEHRSKKYGVYYQDIRWKKLRDYYMDLHPICEECMFEGRSVPAEECHHRIPWSWFTDENDRRLALLDVDNLQPLCRMHHHEKHKYLNKPDNFEQTAYYKKIHSLNGTV